MSGSGLIAKCPNCGKNASFNEYYDERVDEVGYYARCGYCDYHDTMPFGIGPESPQVTVINEGRPK